MILSLAVLIYQTFFVGVMYVARRLGKVIANIALVACLLWTATHIFLVPLAVLQTAVILGSYFWFKRRAEQKAPALDR
ncbi:MAG: hypothetical protein WA956_06970 [Stenotrophomonas sp.]